MNKKFVITAAILTVTAIGFFTYKKLVPEAETYKTSVINKDDIEVTILTTGTVQPQNRLEIKSPVAGRIEEVLVDIGDVVKKGQVLAWLSSTERAALLDAARSSGPAEVKRWEGMYRPTPITAPIDGTVILRNVESGQSFTATDAVLVMSNRLTVKAQVDETDLAQIKLKQPAIIRLDAYPEQAIDASVEQIAYESKVVNNVTTYLITVLPKEMPTFMRSGMTANVTFLLESKKGVLTVLNEFIKYENGKPSVLVQGPDKKPISKDIKLGTTDGKKSEVLEGLNENDTILLAELKKDAKAGSNPFSPMGGRRPGRGK